jgi:zinc protease
MKKTRRIHQLLFVFFLALPVLVWVNPLIAEQLQSDCITSGWPSDRSDLQPDPGMVRGTLSNGMRYVVMENKEPEDRVAVYLYINAGSLNETAEQRGLAHFLEHMLFNGTTHFPPGTLINFFQSIGMNFGGDTNAHTAYDETSYHLILPDGTEDILRKGFLVISDYARGALLLEDEVERERGVILAEKRTRDSAGYRTNVKSSEFKFRGSLLPDRQIIGDETVLKTADSSLLKSYYDSWYRPENMMLVVVGDIDQQRVLPIIAEVFSPLQAEGVTPECPDFGKLESSGLEIFYHHEGDLGRTEVSIESVWNRSPQEDSYALQLQDLKRYLSIRILQSRLNKIQEKQSDILAGAGYYSGDLLQRIRYSTLTATTDAEKWQTALGLLDEVLRQALHYGFFQEEFDREKNEVLSLLESAVLTAESRESDDIARAIIRQFNDNKVSQSPRQELELYSGMLAKMNLSDVNDVFQQDWKQDSRIISVKGTARLPEDKAEQIISSAYRETVARELVPYALQDNGHFPYLTIPVADPGAILLEEVVEDIDVERIVFKNNVSVTLKRTDFEPNTVRIVIDVGRGHFSEPVPGLGMLTEEVVNDSGTGALSKTALDELLSGTTVKAGFSVGEESFHYSGNAVSKEAEQLFQLLYSMLQDPGVRDQAYVLAKNRLRQMYDRLNSDIQGTVQTRVNSFLASGDPRVGLPPWEQVDALNIDQIKKWLLPELANGGLEVAIVGDFDPAEMKRLVLQYFGTMHNRSALSADSSSLKFPEGQQFVTEVTSSVDKSLIVVAWPTAGFWDISRTRRLHVLAEIFRERLRLVIREKLGASYSTTVFSAPSRVYGEYGSLQVHIVVEPGREQEIINEVKLISEQLQSGNISSAELERVKGPFMTSLKDSVKSNQYWLQSVLAKSGRHPVQLVWPKSLLSDFSSITSGEIEDLARKYLVGGKKATAIVKPVVKGQSRN